MNNPAWQQNTNMRDKAWDKKRISEIIKILKGEMLMRRYAHATGISVGYISKMCAGEYCPSVKSIYKLWEGSEHPEKNRLKHELMLLLAGHSLDGEIDFNTGNSLSVHANPIICVTDNYNLFSISIKERIKQKYEALNLAGDLKAYCQREFVAHALLKDAMKGYEYELIHDGLNLSDFSSTGRYKINDTYEWWFHFIPFDTIPDFLHYYNANPYALIGILALQGIDVNRKITLVTYNKEIFDFILSLPLNVLRADISVVNVSETDILPKLEQEKFLSSYSGNGEHAYCLTI